MEIEEFALGKSRVHTLDPRVKILLAVIFSVVIALSNTLTMVALSFILPLTALTISKVSFLKVMKRLLVVNGFILFLCLMLPFSKGETAVYTLGSWSIYLEGINEAFLVALKSNAIVLMSIAMLGTSSIFTLAHALSHMGFPNKLVHLIFFCFRYIHVIHGEYHRLLTAMKVRGFKPSTNLFTYKSYAHLIGMLLVRSYDRSNRIVAAMKCRGFNGRFYILHDYEMRKSDYVVAVSGTLFSLLLFAVK